jgi:hypothetical protein
VPPKEYNLVLDYDFDCSQKKWDTLNKKFVSKLMDNQLEFVLDFAHCFF